MEQVSKAGQDALERPVTYGDVFGAPGPIRKEPITPEDAGLMQSAETLTLGKTQKDGAASVMQAAAEENVKAGLLNKETHSAVAEEGVAVVETIIPGAKIDMEFVGAQPVLGNIKPLPTDPLTAAEDAITIGEALEAAAIGAGDKAVEASDARAIQSAVVRATGTSGVSPGGLAAAAQSAADLNPRVPSADKTTLSDLLMDASLDLEADKIVTQEDALKVLHAEIRNSPSGQPQPGGVAAAIQAAADVNERAGLVEPASGAVDRAFPKEDTLPGAPDAEQAPSDAVKLSADKDSSTEPLLPQKETPEKELAEPVPSHVKKD